MKILLKLASLSLLLCACSLLAPREKGSITYYVLQPAECSVDSAHVPHPYALLIGETSASRLIDSQRILFSRDESTRGLYQFAFWIESPTVRFSNLLLARLECARLFRTQTRSTTLAKADLILNTQMLDFYHDVSVDPSIARVNIRAELLELKSREILASRNFARNIELTQASAAHAVEGLNQAIDEILAEMTVWLGEQLPEKS